MVKKILFSLLSIVLILPTVTGTVSAEENIENVTEESNFSQNLVKNGDFELVEDAPESVPEGSGTWLDVDLWENNKKPVDWQLQMWRNTQNPENFHGNVIEENGNHYLNLSVKEKSGNSQMFLKQMGVSVSAGTIYKVALDYRVNNLDGNAIQLRVEQVDGTGKVINTINNNIPKSTEWDTFNVELTPAVGIVKYNLVIVSPGNTISDFDIDNVVVSYNDKEVNSISMDATPLKIREEEISYVSAIALPETADNRKLLYNSSDETVATIESNGKITALSKGTTTITVTSESNPNVFVTKSVTVIGKNESKNPNLIVNGDFEITEATPTETDGKTWIDKDLWENDLKPQGWNYQKYPVNADNSKFRGEVIEENGNKYVQITVSDNSPSTQAFFKTKVEEMPDYGVYNVSLDYKLIDYTGIKPFVRVEDAWRSGQVIHTTEYKLDVEATGEWETLSFTHTLQKNSAANVMIVIPFGATATFALDNIVWAEAEKDVTSIEIDQEPIHIKLNEEYQIEATVLPDYATDKSVFFESSDGTIATVNNEGKVLGVSEGHVTITATSFQKPSITNTKEIYVHDGDILAESLTITEIEDEVGVGNKRFLNYKVYPASSDNVENLKVEWSVSDNTVASISDGLITFNKPGKITLKVESKELGIYGEKVILVKDSTYSKDYQLIKDRIVSKIVGSEELNNSNDKYVNDYIEKAELRTEQLLSTLDTSENRDKLWTKSSNSNNITAEFQNIRGLAVSFAMPNNKYYEDPELHKTIVEAVDFMLTTTTFGKGWSGNWWDWQVGGSQALADIMVLLDSYNYSGLTEEYAKALSFYNYDVKKQINGAVNTGANLSDSALVVLSVATVRSDDDRMNHLKQLVPTVFAKGTSGDGMYDDGSLIQHGNHGYNGSYGAELIKGAGSIISTMYGTEWEINSENTTNMAYFFETVEKGFIPMVQNGHVLDFVSGRDVSRPPQRTFSSPTQKNGSNYIASLLTIADFAPTDLQLKIKEHVKYWYENSKDHFDYLADPRDFQHLSNLEAVLNDTSIEANIDKGFRSYNMMARALYRTDVFTATVTMTTKRIANYESINREHLKGWNTGDGALYIYNKELDNFNESYRPTVDYNRIPGTTTDTKDLAIPNRNSGTTSPGIDWGSGTTNGTNGTAATMVDKSLQNQKDVNGVAVNLKATKSYYFIDGKVIALGSNINGTTDDTIETIIENRIITKTKKGYMSVNGKSITDLSKMTVDNNDWAYLGGRDTETSFGYVFLEGGNIEAGKVNRTGKFIEINEEFNIPDEFNEDYFQIRYHHGKNVVDDTYAYVMLPGYSEEETTSFAKSSSIKIIKQDDEAHIIYDEESNILMANIFKPNVSVDLKDTNLSLSNVSFNTIGSFIIEKNGRDVVATMADGTLRNTQVELELEGPIAEVLSSGSKMNVSGSNDKYKVIYDTTGSQGIQQEVVFKTYRTEKDLASLVEEAKTYEESKYTKASFDAFKAILDKAEKSLMKRSTPENLYVELESAIDNLVLAGDYKALESYLLNVINTMDDQNYTNYSQSKIREKVSEYQDLITEREVQSKLDVAKDEVSQFVTTLEKRLDLSDAEQLIKDFVNLDSKKYTKESFVKYVEAIEALKSLIEKYDENAPLTITQVEIDDLVKDTLETYDSLVKVNDSKDDDKEEEKPTETEDKKPGKEKPNTGISNSNILFTSILVLAGFALLILYKRKEKEI